MPRKVFTEEGAVIVEETDKSQDQRRTTLLLPSNLNIREILPYERRRKIHLHVYLCHTIIERRVFGPTSDEENEFVHLSSKSLERMMTTKEYRKVVSDLTEAGVIEIDGRYSIGTERKSGKCLGYRFTPKYATAGFKKVEIYNRPLSRKIRKSKEVTKPEDRTMQFLLQQLGRLSIDLDAANEFVLSCSSPTFKWSSPQMVVTESGKLNFAPRNSNGGMNLLLPIPSLCRSPVLHLERDLSLVSDTTVQLSLISDTPHRLSSISDKCIGLPLIDDKCNTSSIIDSDRMSFCLMDKSNLPSKPDNIKVSPLPQLLHTLQTYPPSPLPPSPYVLTFSEFATSARLHRLEMIHKASKKEVPWEFKIDSKTGRLYTNLTNLNRNLRPYLRLDTGQLIVGIDVGECQPFLMGVLLLEQAQCLWPEGIPQDLLHFLGLVQGRGFYRFIMDCCGIAEGERDSFKKEVFGNIFYCTAWWAEHPNNAAGKTFIKHFPNVYTAIKGMKGNHRSTLPNQLMRKESEIIIQGVCKQIAELQDEGFFIATIHDCILTSEDKADMVKGLLADLFKERYGRVPILKTEKINRA